MFRDKRPRVYFIRAGAHVKIGTTIRNIGGRLSTLQTSHYETLEVLGVQFCDPSLERKLHARFRASHVRGEWFLPTPDITAYIEQHTVTEAPLPIAYER